MKPPKPKACKNPACGKLYTPRHGASSLETWCDVDCGIAIARIRQAKQANKNQAKREKQRKAMLSQWRKDAAESRSNYRRGRAKSGPERQAQDSVNAYIVIRDENKPCIVHGYECPHARAGFHAGHFRPVGAAPEIRYNTWNIHKQCGISNMGSQQRAKWGGSTDQLYEANLIARIGQAKVDWLKGPHKPLQPSADYLFRLKSIFRRRARHVQKLRAGK
jgi:hypothetical protein